MISLIDDLGDLDDPGDLDDLSDLDDGSITSLLKKNAVGWICM